MKYKIHLDYPTTHNTKTCESEDEVFAFLSVTIADHFEEEQVKYTPQVKKIDEAIREGLKNASKDYPLLMRLWLQYKKANRNDGLTIDIESYISEEFFETDSIIQTLDIVKSGNYDLVRNEDEDVM